MIMAGGRRAFLILSLILAPVGLQACARHLPPLPANGMLTISGRGTEGMTQAAASQSLLAKAAKLTVDHGFRYFTLINPAAARPGNGGTPLGTPLALQPGSNITIRLFHEGDVKASAPGILDAFMLLSAGKPSRVPAAR